MDTNEDDLDTHMCLSCETTIIGLDNYIRHKKHECPHRKDIKKSVSTSVHQTPMTVDVHEVGHLHAPSHMSPSTSGIVNPNVVLGSNNDDVDKFHDFISSLALQSRTSLPDKTTEKRPNDLDLMDLGNERIPISNLLNLNLGFSSDEDPDLSEYLKDSDDDYYPPENHTGGKWKAQESHTGGKWKSPEHHTGGKWKPPETHTGGKWKPGTRLMPPRGHTGGKWKPGMGPRPTGGKGARHLSDDDDDDDETELAKQDDEVNESDSKNKQDDMEPNQTGGKIFSHDIRPAPIQDEPDEKDPVTEITEDAPKEEVSQKDDEKTEDVSVKDCEEEVETSEQEHYCTVCKDHFYNQYTMARHLLSKYHHNRAKGKPEAVKLYERYHFLILRLSPFQCGCCKFYCNSNDDLKVHLRTDLHVEKTSDSVAPQLCTLCRFMTPDNEKMVEHISSDGHISRVGELTKKRPCVIRLSRKRVDCRLCGATMQTVAELKKHILAEHRSPGEKKKHVKRQCEHCDKSFSSRTSLMIHMRRRHTKERPYTCEPCNKTYADKYTLQLHMNTKMHLKTMGEKVMKDSPELSAEDKKSGRKLRGVSNYKCEHCDFKSQKHGDLRPHCIKHHPEKAKSCKNCGLTTYRTVEYRAHLASRRHKSMLKALEDDNEDVYTCSTCGWIFRTEKDYLKHTLSHNFKQARKEVDALVQQKFEKYLSGMPKKKSKDTLKCPECDKMISQSNVKLHLRSHVDVQHKCFSCDKSFTSVSMLKCHMEKIHIGTVPQCVCTECGKKFMKPSSYKHHVATVHRNAPKAFVCETCGHAFVSKWQLNHHSKIHGMKHLKCTFDGCRRVFRSQSELVIHIRTHTNERPYLCDQCGYRGKSQNQLTRHRRTHTGERNFSCQYCPYRAVNSTHLRRHMRVHIGSKPYKCPYCPYECNTQENIRKHIIKTKKHAGLKVYVCKLCEFGTNDSKSFRDHLLAYHKEEVATLDANLDIVSVYSGLYRKESDPKTPLEGEQVLPVRERKKKAPPQDTTDEPSKKKKRRREILVPQSIHDHAEAVEREMQNFAPIAPKHVVVKVPPDIAEWLVNMRQESSVSTAGQPVGPDSNSVPSPPRLVPVNDINDLVSGGNNYGRLYIHEEDSSSARSSQRGLGKNLPMAVPQATGQGTRLQKHPLGQETSQYLSTNLETSTEIKTTVIDTDSIFSLPLYTTSTSTEPPSASDLANPDLINLVSLQQLATYPKDTVRSFLKALKDSLPKGKGDILPRNSRDLSISLTLVEKARTPKSLVPVHHLLEISDEFLSVVLEIAKGVVTKNDDAKRNQPEFRLEKDNSDNTAQVTYIELPESSTTSVEPVSAADGNIQNNYDTIAQCLTTHMATANSIIQNHSTAITQTFSTEPTTSAPDIFELAEAVLCSGGTSTSNSEKSITMGLRRPLSIETLEPCDSMAIQLLSHLAQGGVPNTSVGDKVD